MSRLGTNALLSLPLTLTHVVVVHLFGNFELLGIIAAFGLLLTQISIWRVCNDEKLSTETALRRCSALLVGMGWMLSLQWHLTPNIGIEYTTPVSLLVVLIPLLIPLTPQFTILIAGLTALGQPVGAAISLALGLSSGTARDLLFSAFGAATATAVAYLSARLTSMARSDLARDIGGYRLIRKIGSGGAGEVWEGRHRLLARPAAVKLLTPPTMSRSFLIRFEREAQATALLSSEHTVSLFDFGISQEGQPYYVMELLKGFDLQSLVEEQGPLHPARVVQLMIQACDSLAEAHDVGIVHRDIKPSNLFLARRGLSLDFLKVLDFGMVSLQEHPGASTHLTTLSQEGFLYGTPAYIPAEQAAGLTVDHRGDLYQLGCVMFFLLTGRVVFEKKNPLGLAIAHAGEPPPRPSGVSPRAIPKDLDDIVLRLLEKNPDDRFQTAKEVLDALSALEWSSEWTSERAANWWSTYAPSAGEGRNTVVQALRRHAL